MYCTRVLGWKNLSGVLFYELQIITLAIFEDRPIPLSHAVDIQYEVANIKFIIINVLILDLI